MKKYRSLFESSNLKESKWVRKDFKDNYSNNLMLLIGIYTNQNTVSINIGDKGLKSVIGSYDLDQEFVKELNKLYGNAEYDSGVIHLTSEDAIEDLTKRCKKNGLKWSKREIAFQKKCSSPDECYSLMKKIMQ